MKLLDWLASRTMGGKSIEVKPEDLDKYVDTEKMESLCATEFYMLVATSIISGIISKCIFRTCLNGEEIKGDEYYLWNVEPNKGQSAADFKKEIVDVLFRKNEALIVEAGGQLFVADSYTEGSENILQEKTFTDITKGSMHLDKKYRMSDVIYLKLNNRNITSLVQMIGSGYEKIAVKAMEHYEKANGRKGILKIDASVTNKKFGEKTFGEFYEELMNKRFEKYFSAPNAVLPLFDGFEYTEKEQRTKTDGITNDYKNMLNEAAAKVALAFNIPPQILVGNVVGLKEAVQNMLSFCVDPLANTIQTAANKARYKKAVLKNSYMWIDTTSVLHVDIFEVATSVDKLIASGFTSIDELRTRAAMMELGTEESQKHWITKNYEAIEKAGKGEGENADNQNDGST